MAHFSASPRSAAPVRVGCILSLSYIVQPLTAQPWQPWRSWRFTARCGIRLQVPVLRTNPVAVLLCSLDQCQRQPYHLLEHPAAQEVCQLWHLQAPGTIFRAELPDPSIRLTKHRFHREPPRNRIHRRRTTTTIRDHRQTHRYWPEDHQMDGQMRSRQDHPRYLRCITR